MLAGTRTRGPEGPAKAAVWSQEERIGSRAPARIATWQDKAGGTTLVTPPAC